MVVVGRDGEWGEHHLERGAGMNERCAGMAGVSNVDPVLFEYLMLFSFWFTSILCSLFSSSAHYSI